MVRSLCLVTVLGLLLRVAGLHPLGCGELSMAGGESSGHVRGEERLTSTVPAVRELTRRDRKIR